MQMYMYTRDFFRMYGLLSLLKLYYNIRNIISSNSKLAVKLQSTYLFVNSLKILKKRSYIIGMLRGLH